MHQVGVLCILAAAPAKGVARKLCLPAIGGAKERIADLAVVGYDLSSGCVHRLDHPGVAIITVINLIAARISNFVIWLTRRQLVDGIAACRYRLRLQRFYMRTRTDFIPNYTIKILLHRHAVDHM